MLTCGLDRHDNTQPIMTAHLVCKDQSYWYVDWQWDGPIGGCSSLMWTASSERVNVNLMKWQERVWGQTHWWAAEIILLLPWQHHSSYCDTQQWSCRAVCVFVSFGSEEQLSVWRGLNSDQTLGHQAVPNPSGPSNLLNHQDLVWEGPIIQSYAWF